MANGHENLLVDRAAAAERPDDRAIREWAADQRVFISSVIEDYGDFRSAAARAVETVGAHPVWFERFGGRDSDPHQAYLAEVASSDIYVGLLGERYGRLLPSRFSATHAEYLEAEKRGLRLSIWAQSGIERDGHQQRFLEDIRTFNVTGGYSDPEQLERELTVRINAIAAEDLSPWCRLGNLIFRAHEIQESGNGCTVEAVIKDPAVAEALRAARSSFFGRRDLPFCYADRVLDAWVKDATETTRATRSKHFTLTLQTSAPERPTLINVSGKNADELTELALREALIGEKPNLGALGWLSKLDNPFDSLRTLEVPEEAVRPIAVLLINDLLVRERGISRVTRFQLGPPIAGQRVIALEWQPAAQYSNKPPPPARSIEGTIDFP